MKERTTLAALAPLTAAPVGLFPGPAWADPVPVPGEVEVDDGFGGTDVFRTEGGRTPRLESNDIGEWIWADVTDGGWEHL